MIAFFTSSPTGPLDGSRKVNGVDEKNQFLLNLKRYWKKDARCLMITAFPDNDDANDEMRGFFENAFASRGLTSSTFDLWDGRTTDYSKETLHSYDVIFLGGGHVPTQNAFFQKISLREKIAGFDGMVIGISAGTMNSADEVYVQPEEPGEAIDPNFEKRAIGLNLTKVQILPHYQMVKHNYLDGMRLFEDITYADSYGRELLVLNDGSYLMSVDGVESIHGEAYLLKDGVMRQISSDYQ